jgi:hypothetical protein
MLDTKEIPKEILTQTNLPVKMAIICVVNIRMYIHYSIARTDFYLQCICTDGITLLVVELKKELEKQKDLILRQDLK